MPFRRRGEHQEPAGANEGEPQDGRGKWGGRAEDVVQFGEIIRNTVEEITRLRANLPEPGRLLPWGLKRTSASREVRESKGARGDLD